MMKLYTKRGDKGKTTLCGMEVSKNHPRLSVLGALDELESCLGVVLACDPRLKILEGVQADLMEIGAFLGTAKADVAQKLSKRTLVLEKEIDKIWGDLPDLKHFVFPGGGKTGATLHLSRAICRRTERELVFLSEKEEIPTEIITYLNRLSDFLFTLARWVNQKEGYEEKIWSSYGE